MCDVWLHVVDPCQRPITKKLDIRHAQYPYSLFYRSAIVLLLPCHPSTRHSSLSITARVISPSPPQHVSLLLHHPSKYHFSLTTLAVTYFHPRIPLNTQLSHSNPIRFSNFFLHPWFIKRGGNSLVYKGLPFFIQKTVEYQHLPTRNLYPSLIGKVLTRVISITYEAEVRNVYKNESKKKIKFRKNTQNQKIMTGKWLHSTRRVTQTVSNLSYTENPSHP